jgi:phosphonoacetate hydrolase
MQQQRLVIALIDGLGLDYYPYMPALADMGKKGFFKQVRGVMPSVTNANNVSICCGAWPDEHCISANSYYDCATGQAVYMNSAELIKKDTIFQKAKKQGISSALLTSKRKTVELFHKDTTIAIAAESASQDLIDRYGAPPDIYSSEINYWLWKVAIDILKNRPDIGAIYVHTTDYPMHRWAPGEGGSVEHLSRIDSLICEARQADPEAAFLVTADHGMNAKKRCWDLMQACKNRGLNLRAALSPERDYYIVHHRNFAGSGWIWVEKQSDIDHAVEICGSLKGVERVLTREEAVSEFRLPGEYIGDLMVLGDRDTVFGSLDMEMEALPLSYRAHGSTYEMDVPLIIHGWNGDLPAPDYFQNNLHLTRFLWSTL